AGADRRLRAASGRPRGAGVDGGMDRGTQRAFAGAGVGHFRLRPGLVMAPLSSTVLSTVKPASAGSGAGIYGTTTQIANAAGVAAIGAVFFAVEAAESVRLALFVASALFALSIVTSAAFLSWMRRATNR